SADSMRTGRRLIVEAWGRPEAMLACAGGFAFEGERAWLNERVFAVDMEAVCAAISSEHPTERFLVARPGQTFTMEKGHLVRVDDEAPFLRTAPRDAWPLRARAASPITPDYAPATGRRAISPEDEAALAAALDDFAGTLV